MKVCPLRMLALESNQKAIQNTGNADQIIKDRASSQPSLLRETIGCLEQNCAWWNENECAVVNITWFLNEIACGVQKK